MGVRDETVCVTAACGRPPCGICAGSVQDLCAHRQTVRGAEPQNAPSAFLPLQPGCSEGGCHMKALEAFAGSPGMRRCGMQEVQMWDAGMRAVGCKVQDVRVGMQDVGIWDAQ